MDRIFFTFPSLSDPVSSLFLNISFTFGSTFFPFFTFASLVFHVCFTFPFNLYAHIIPHSISITVQALEQTKENISYYNGVTIQFVWKDLLEWFQDLDQIRHLKDFVESMRDGTAYQEPFVNYVIDCKLRIEAKRQDRSKSFPFWDYAAYLRASVQERYIFDLTKVKSFKKQKWRHFPPAEEVEGLGGLLSRLGDSESVSDFYISQKNDTQNLITKTDQVMRDYNGPNKDIVGDFSELAKEGFILFNEPART